MFNILSLFADLEAKGVRPNWIFPLCILDAAVQLVNQIYLMDKDTQGSIWLSELDSRPRNEAGPGRRRSVHFLWDDSSGNEAVAKALVHSGVHLILHIVLCYWGAQADGHRTPEFRWRRQRQRNVALGLPWR